MDDVAAVMFGTWPVTLIVGLLTLTVAQDSGLVESPTERQVVSAEGARTLAKRRDDHAQLNNLLAPDFVKINRFGRLLGKGQAVPLSRNPSYATADVELHIYDNAVLVTGRETDEGEQPGGVRFLRVWIHDGRRWLNLLDEETLITSEAEIVRLAARPASIVDRVVNERPGADANHTADSAEAPAAAARDIRNVERAYRRAERINDSMALASLRAPEFLLVDRLGKAVSPTSAQTIRAVQDDDFGVRVHGSTAVVIGSVLRTNLDTGATDRYRYSTVWMRHNGSWQVVAEQRTPIS